MFQRAMLLFKVSDLSRSVAFYAETLGLERGPQYGDYWAEVTAPGVHIGLQPGGVAHDPTRHVSLGLRVGNLDEVKATLVRRGVTFTADDVVDGARQAYFIDPDGNSLYLIEGNSRD